jgi:ubiquinone/menaquinone biosynthesis C-methylase UbiE
VTTDSQRQMLSDFGLTDEDRADWESSGRPDSEFEDWLTDRVARRPSGDRARAVYGAEDVHDFARRDILEALALGPGDRLLDTGCGGGLLLRDAAATGATVTGLDHSPDMVELARERAPGATVLVGDANALPFEDGAFTAVSMSVVFFFLDDPVGALREARRVLAPCGRLAFYTTSAELRGTGAAHEPISSRGHWYTDDELASVATEAGFRDASVRSSRGGQLLTARA